MSNPYGRPTREVKVNLTEAVKNLRADGWTATEIAEWIRKQGK